MNVTSEKPLGCGRCGYAVQGLPELKCPECGADLTVVGITSGSKTRSALIAISILLGFTAAVVAGAVISFKLASPLLPTYEEAYYSIQIVPGSGEYDELGLHIDADLILPASSSSNSSLSISPGANAMTTVTMCDPGAQISVTDIYIFFKAKKVNGQPITPGTAIGIDPITQQARWVDAQGQRFSTQSAFTDQDLLVCFDAHGVDISRPDVQAEAAQIHAFFASFIQGQHQLTLSAFSSRAYSGGGATTSKGPPWLLPTYISGWVLLWVLGLILIIRRSLKLAKG